MLPIRHYQPVVVGLKARNGQFGLDIKLSVDLGNLGQSTGEAAIHLWPLLDGWHTDITPKE